MFKLFLTQRATPYLRRKSSVDAQTKGPEPQLEAVCSTDVHRMEWTQLICCTLQLFIYFLGLI